MHKLLKIVGWGLSILGAVFLLCLVLVLVENDPKSRGAAYGFVILAALVGTPGGVILWRTRLKERAQALRQQLAGYIRTFDAFTVEELARKIGKTEMETETLIASLAGEGGFRLAFHRQTRRYLHQDRLRQNHRCLSRCPSCGAAMGNQVVFEGEVVCCQYCNHPLPQVGPENQP
jgi:hypothetical protein